MLTSMELCAGAGGQALGLEIAGFRHVVLIENDQHACQTLRLNRPDWNVLESDVLEFDPRPYVGVDLVAGGVPCPPFSVAGHRLGPDDERDLFPVALDIVAATRPKAVMLENVRGLLDPKFQSYRDNVLKRLRNLGYFFAEWTLLNASGFGVPQLRPRSILVAMPPVYAEHFRWPDPQPEKTQTVGSVLRDLMAENGWDKVDEWVEGAQDIGPTLVGGSKKHGGPDLGPTRARQGWAKLGVDGRGIANEAPLPGFEGMPRLTTAMAARIQGFPDSWSITGKKTSAYRQIGNAFPPPVANAVGRAIAEAIKKGDHIDNTASTRIQSEASELFLEPRRGDD